MIDEENIKAGHKISTAAARYAYHDVEEEVTYEDQEHIDDVRDYPFSEDSLVQNHS